MTEEEIQDWKDNIDFMSQEEMARLQRFAPSGHVIFSTPQLSDYFKKRFAELGGMTPEISKAIGFDGKNE